MPEDDDDRPSFKSRTGVSAGSVLRDRRRPGRIAEVYVHLKPLLRQDERDKALLTADDLLDADEPAPKPVLAPTERQDWSPGTGVVFGVILGGIIWAMLAFVFSLLF